MLLVVSSFGQAILRKYSATSDSRGSLTFSFNAGLFREWLQGNIMTSTHIGRTEVKRTLARARYRSIIFIIAAEKGPPE
jgi:hypothetical protein